MSYEMPRHGYIVMRPGRICGAWETCEQAAGARLRTGFLSAAGTGWLQGQWSAVLAVTMTMKETRTSLPALERCFETPATVQ